MEKKFLYVSKKEISMASFFFFVLIMQILHSGNRQLKKSRTEVSKGEIEIYYRRNFIEKYIVGNDWKINGRFHQFSLAKVFICWKFTREALILIFRCQGERENRENDPKNRTKRDTREARCGEIFRETSFHEWRRRARDLETPICQLPSRPRSQ